LELTPAGSPAAERYNKIAYSPEAIDELLVKDLTKGQAYNGRVFPGQMKISDEIHCAGHCSDFPRDRLYGISLNV
jgi:hypothetical protein